VESFAARSFYAEIRHEVGYSGREKEEEKSQDTQDLGSVLIMEAYLDPNKPGSFRGLDSIRRHVKVGSNIAREWLMEKNAYTLHKQSRTKFIRRRTVSRGIDELWQADLVDLGLLSNENDHYRYLLTCIDVFSKYARVEPLKNKNGKSLTDAFSKMIVDKYCKLLQTDKGTEFLNGTF